jgi:uncharacterized membrane protein YagU involved in acid resistance
MVLCAGVIAGTLDIGAAALINRVNPFAILQGIAGVAFKSAPLAGEVGAAIVGLMVQWGLSFIIAAIAIECSARMRMLREHWIGAGLAYGVVIFAVMNYVVLPLSRFGHIPHFTPFRFFANVVAMLVFGLIVAAFGRGSQIQPDLSRPPETTQNAL